MKEIEKKTEQHSIAQIFEPTLEDWESVKRLRLEALQNDPQAFGSPYESEVGRTDEEWKRRLEMTFGEDSKEMLVLAKNGDEFVGMVGAFPKNEKTWNIKAMYVKPVFRGKGVSRKLVEEILRRIDARKGVENTELMVNTSQEAAIRLYQKYGFEIVERVKDQELGDGNMYDEYIMRRTRKTENQQA